MGYPMPDGSTTRARAIAIFTYLRDLAQFRTKPIRDVDDYPRVFWFADVPRERGCHSIAWETPVEDVDTDWLEVQRQPEPRPPSPPPSCLDWLEAVRLADPANELTPPHEVSPAPSLNERAKVEGKPGLLLEEVPEVLAAWHEYLDRQWRPWRDLRRRFQEVQDAYARLFAMNQDLKRLGEEFELVIGFGYLTWRHPSGYIVRRHVLAAQATLEFDAARGAFTVRASSDGVRLALELDCIDPQDRFDLATQQAIEAQLSTIAESPWNRAV